eukprot:1157489-Pelagomonas_calceolata.AAC.3
MAHTHSGTFALSLEIILKCAKHEDSPLKKHRSSWKKWTQRAGRTRQGLHLACFQNTPTKGVSVFQDSQREPACSVQE